MTSTPPKAHHIKMLEISRRQATLLALGTASTPVWSQFRVEISGVGVTQLPIAIAPFKGEDAAPQKISVIMSADLLRSGQFKLQEPAVSALDESSRPDLAQWRQKGADHLVVGSITKLADGRYDMRFRLWDTVRGQDLGAQSFAVSAGDLRFTAHRIADIVYEKLTGEKGVFATRIVYITKASQRYNLWIADADGEGVQSALPPISEPLISASWSPNGAQIAYVSFEQRKPVVYVQNIVTGNRRVLANFKGSNSAPAWSPDSKTLAVTLTKDGSSQIYSMDSNGSDARRLSQSSSIDTEPVYSPDGKSIYFVSDRGGSPQIYRMGAMGEGASRAERVSFTGSYNISPAISPDGRSMAYISRVGGAFKLYVSELGANPVAITDTNADERPSFAPNGKLIMYATKQAGREALMTTSLDGKIKARLGSQGGDIREPHWGPFIKQ